METKCKWCGKVFTKTTPEQKYCSKKCRKIEHHVMWKNSLPNHWRSQMKYIQQD